MCKCAVSTVQGYKIKQQTLESQNTTILYYIYIYIYIYTYEKILSTPSFGGEVKPSVPCRRFAACKRSLELHGSGILDEICRNISRPQSSTLHC